MIIISDNGSVRCTKLPRRFRHLISQNDSHNGHFALKLTLFTTHFIEHSAHPSVEWLVCVRFEFEEGDAIEGFPDYMYERFWWRRRSTFVWTQIVLWNRVVSFLFGNGRLHQLFYYHQFPSLSEEREERKKHAIKLIWQSANSSFSLRFLAHRCFANDYDGRSTIQRHRCCRPSIFYTLHELARAANTPSNENVLNFSQRIFVCFFRLIDAMCLRSCLRGNPHTALTPHKNTHSASRTWYTNRRRTSL